MAHLLAPEANLFKNLGGAPWGPQNIFVPVLANTFWIRYTKYVVYRGYLKIISEIFKSTLEFLEENSRWAENH